MDLCFFSPICDCPITGFVVFQLTPKRFFLNLKIFHFPDKSGTLSSLFTLATLVFNVIKYRCAGQAQPTPNPLAKDQLRPKMGGGSPQTPLFTQGGQFCPENGGRIPPNPPLYSRRPILSLEWGEGPPKPPSRHQGTKYALEWGGGSPPNPPSRRQRAKNNFSQTF